MYDTKNGQPNFSIEQTKALLWLILLVALGGGLIWFLWGFRINVPQGKVLVLVKKLGKNPPSQDIIAPSDRHKGVQYKVLSEGWHWYSSFLWRREIHPATFIKASQLGVLIRRYGQPLSSGEILASPLNLAEISPTDTRGVVAEVLKPGKYNINPYAYHVEVYPITEVPAGHVGVVVNRTGLDQDNFNYISQVDYKGVQPDVREPGTYYMNPYTHEIIPYNIRVQKTDFENENEINFMSFDSYEIGLNATVEWRVAREMVPEVYVRIGDLKDVEQKFIIPYARSFCRIIGSTNYAIDYISGESREAIQQNFHKMLEEIGQKNGIIISSVLIRRIIPPQVLREIINVRGLEKEKRQKFVQEIEKVKSDAQVAKRKEEIIQSQARVEENISKQMALIKMKGDREIQLQQANKNQAIALVNFDVADVERQTIAERGRASILQNFNIRKAGVEALHAQVQSFGGGSEFARYHFNQKLRIDSVLVSDNSPIADLLNRYGSPKEAQGREVQQ